MDPNRPQKPSSSGSPKRPPPPIKILASDHESPSAATAQAISTKSPNPSTPLTPRHRRSKAHVDPAAVLDAWNSSPRTREFTKSTTETSPNLASTKHNELASSYSVNSLRLNSEVHIQAGSEHGVEAIDWAMDADTKVSDPCFSCCPRVTYLRAECKQQRYLKQLGL
ncbi:hypothetical protein P171DRAFT_432636, partial [Karstenula rhodostoma CBS 690.94]